MFFGKTEDKIDSTAAVPLPPNKIVEYLDFLATNEVKSSATSFRISPNSSSLGQISGTICASLTVFVVVAGPGFEVYSFNFHLFS